MTDLSYRLDDFGRRLAIMEQELDELRRSTRPERKPETPPVLWKPVTASPSAPPRSATPAPKPVRERREIDWAALFGAKALAWAGGAVTLLGIVFFFVLAVNRGWIGPVTRVTLGRERLVRLVEAEEACLGGRPKGLAVECDAMKVFQQGRRRL